MEHLKMDWRDKAACLTVDPELFFPVGNTGPAVDQIEKAKTVCGRCTVSEQCLQYALETNQDSGVWGGLSEDERRALKRRAARAPRQLGRRVSRRRLQRLLNRLGSRPSDG
ncbi:hypothetical protein GCM10025869_03630 [Homoserinibacter gongjuensis]|uniref:Transcriptional regulator WhiB n=1 Tax=Homoserinibacter gongjuensis TaxID=1162968 RepID=A0ABQ6JPG4_9MICO|nr:hypothetical protein GCM10025869_03630 [Homoserinibacter gongjuensis]